MEQRKIDDLIADLKRNAREERKAALLIGAGCSVEAGIPLASEFVQKIKEQFPEDHAKAKDKTSYAHCMGVLHPDDRHALISKYIDEAKINRAHIAIAQLMKCNFIDRVLTTNFDPLLVRAAALAHFFPAVYDMAASSQFAPNMVRDKAVFHLHGQRDGFVQYHLEDQFKQHKEVLGPLFSDTNAARTWIVAGYSGLNDPVFEQLAAQHDFGRRLYWVTRDKGGPPPSVVEALAGKAAYWVHASDADTFFYQLARELDCMPPEFFDTPFTHLKTVLGSVADAKIPGGDTDLPWLGDALDMIDKAIATFEPLKAEEGAASGEEADQGEVAYDMNDAITDLMAGRVDTIVSRLEGREDLSAFAMPLSWAYVGQGYGFSDLAKQKTGADADLLFEQAYAKYAAALKVKPDLYAAFNSWGLALVEHARNKKGAMAQELFQKAYEKYAVACKGAREEPGVLNNWGLALTYQARQETGAVANGLFQEAIEKYKAALAIKPDMYKVLANWGLGLSDQAVQRTDAEADELFEAAYEKFEAALDIKPDHLTGLCNWGAALAGHARKKTDEDADGLFEQAYAKYAAALAIKPDMHEALSDWGNALAAQAKQQTGAAADGLFVQAYVKYAAALDIKPDKHEALNGWGISLMDQAQQKTGVEKEALLAEAEAKFVKAEELVTGYAAYNLACLAAVRAVEEACRAWLEKSFDAGKLPSLDHINADEDFDSVRETSWFKAFLKKAAKG